MTNKVLKARNDILKEIERIDNAGQRVCCSFYLMENALSKRLMGISEAEEKQINESKLAVLEAIQTIVTECNKMIALGGNKIN